jgi:hypothetical protein
VQPFQTPSLVKGCWSVLQDQARLYYLSSNSRKRCPFPKKRQILSESMRRLGSSSLHQRHLDEHQIFATLNAHVMSILDQVSRVMFRDHLESDGMAVHNGCSFTKGDANQWHRCFLSSHRTSRPLGGYSKILSEENGGHSSELRRLRDQGRADHRDTFAGVQ